MTVASGLARSILLAGAANVAKGFSLVTGCPVDDGPLGIWFSEVVVGSVDGPLRRLLFNARTLFSLDELSARIRISSEKELTADRVVELQFTENADSSKELSKDVSCRVECWNCVTYCFLIKPL